MDRDPRTRAVEALSALLVSDTSLADSQRAVLDVLLEAVPAAAHAGLSMPDEQGRPLTPVSTDVRVAEMDQAQYDSDRGPCLDAWRKKTVVSIPNLAAAADRYPEFVAATAAHGIHSTLSVPFVADGKSLGAVNLYSPTVEGFGPADEALLHALSGASAAFLTNVKAYWGAFDLSTQLEGALRTRAVIEQAKGMLMAHNLSLDPDGAFDLLLQASKRENVKVREIAARIVARQPPAQ